MRRPARRLSLSISISLTLRVAFPSVSRRVCFAATSSDVTRKNRVARFRLPQKGRHTEPDEKSDHRRLYLTFRMMLGVRVAVGRQSNPLERRDVVEEDFDQVRFFSNFFF